MSSDPGKKIYGAIYGNFENRIYADIRSEVYGEDIGQSSWFNSAEQDRFLSWLNLNSESRVLDVCCGAGGPTLRLARLCDCDATGIDNEEKGITTAKAMARTLGLSLRAKFEVRDASRELPFKNDYFDLLVCIDSINHLAARQRVLAEWARVLKPQGMLLFTDPVVLTGPVSNEEISVRGSIGHMLFVPPGENPRLLSAVGLTVVKNEDVTENVAIFAQRRLAAREARAEALTEIEGKAQYDKLQEFLRVTGLLARERRLSRFVYLAKKPIPANIRTMSKAGAKEKL